MTLASLKYSNIHITLIEEIRRKLTEMGKTNWKINFSWVRVHVRIQGNELPETIAKEAATNLDIKESYKKFKKV
jgi:ribonuclease HI